MSSLSTNRLICSEFLSKYWSEMSQLKNYLPFNMLLDRICGVMVSVLALRAIDRGFEPMSG